MSFFIAHEKNGGYPFYENTNDLVPVFTKDYPVGVYQQKNGGYPFYDGVNLINMGVCYNCVNLLSVSIPRTVKRISNYAFSGTKLREVTIAKDCIFFDHSFPSDCVIRFYE